MTTFGVTWIYVLILQPFALLQILPKLDGAFSLVFGSPGEAGPTYSPICRDYTLPMGTALPWDATDPVLQKAVKTDSKLRLALIAPSGGGKTYTGLTVAKALSKRRITLSTSGVVPMMAKCGEEIGVNLAVSLHAVSKDIRDEIVPINRKYGLEELLQACADYPGASNARRITFEYVMLKDKNDSDEDARELVRLIKQYKLPAKVNLIPFNPWPGALYECSTPERVRRFSEIVFEAGISAPVRTPRGRDIDAACGQLKTAAKKMSRAELDRLAEEKQAALG